MLSPLRNCSTFTSRYYYRKSYQGDRDSGIVYVAIVNLAGFIVLPQFSAVGGGDEMWYTYRFSKTERVL